MEPKGSRKQVSQELFLGLLFSFLILSCLLLLCQVCPGQAPPGHGLGACLEPCRVVLVETIPEGLSFGNLSVPNPSTFATWGHLLGTARHSLDIASFYWTLTNDDTKTQEPSARLGEQILGALLELPSRGVALRVAVSAPGARATLADLQALLRSGAAVRTVDLPHLTGGVLHTKFWLVDGAHFYIGSANMDWRSLTQVKELGAAVYNCSCLAKDLAKVFEAYWALGVPGASIPTPWPANYSTSINAETPLRLQLNGTAASVYLSSSPPALCASGRTQDLAALLAIIDGAEAFVDVAVMSYLPTSEFSYPPKFWPTIDDHLRQAVFERGVRLRLLAGCWHHNKASMFPFLKSLAAMADNHTGYSVEVRLFLVPSSAAQARIPYARVNHNKFLVTEKVAYIGTSNWSEDYFTHTAGAGLVVEQAWNRSGTGASVRQQLQEVFERDWSSPYSVGIQDTASWQSFCGTS